ncbi:hypothetical protein BN11_1700013 [Nostocoides australiense Ben110]|uniref:Uncharacterized protein n=1 Tax=Nostocoides australiense Ben110 TaxID=1193182 RepID=W6JVA1_9MICO|nr:hypothetical protein BN11_1700013 [Tetrasphaera australiensis Ben110]
MARSRGPSGGRGRQIRRADLLCCHELGDVAGDIPRLVTGYVQPWAPPGSARHAGEGLADVRYRALAFARPVASMRSGGFARGPAKPLFPKGDPHCEANHRVRRSRGHRRRVRRRERRRGECHDRAVRQGCRRQLYRRHAGRPTAAVDQAERPAHQRGPKQAGRAEGEP